MTGEGAYPYSYMRGSNGPTVLVHCCRPLRSRRSRGSHDDGKTRRTPVRRHSPTSAWPRYSCGGFDWETPPPHNRLPAQCPRLPIKGQHGLRLPLLVGRAEQHLARHNDRRRMASTGNGVFQTTFSLVVPGRGRSFLDSEQSHCVEDHATRANPVRVTSWGKSCPSSNRCWAETSGASRPTSRNARHPPTDGTKHLRWPSTARNRIPLTNTVRCSRLGRAYLHGNPHPRFPGSFYVPSGRRPEAAAHGSSPASLRLTS
jgi:hypothetical protein